MTGRTTIPKTGQKIGLIFATLQEAEPFLEISRAAPLDDTVLTLYDIGPDIPALTVVCGMGKIAAAAACQYLIREHDVGHVINAGVCGALRTDKNFQPGHIFRIATVMEGDHGTEGQAAPEILCPTHWAEQLPWARLVTCDQPVFDTQRRRQLAAKGDLVDMEGAAVARVADLFGTPWTLIKAITDNAGPAARNTLLNNLSAVSSAMARFLWSQMAASGQGL